MGKEPSTSTKEKELKRSLYSSILKDSGRATSTGPAKVLEEFESYLQEPNSPFEEPCVGKEKNGNAVPLRPLMYWKRNVHRFPYLASIARDLFGIPASSGNIERVFTTATDILSAKRSRMKPELFQKLMLIKRNSHLI